MPMSPEEVQAKYPSLKPEDAMKMAQMTGYAAPPPATPEPSWRDNMANAKPILDFKINGGPVFGGGLMPAEQAAPIIEKLKTEAAAGAPPAVAPQDAQANGALLVDAQPPPQSGMVPIGFNTGPQVVPGMSRTAALAKVQQASGEWNRNPEDVAKLEHANNALGLRREQVAETTAMGMDKQADVLSQARQDYEARAAAFEQRQREQQAAEAAEHKKLEDTIKAHNEMKISDNPYWDNKTSGGKIMAAIGMIGAGIASGLGNNSANQFISQQIQNSIDAQKQKIAKSADGINQARGLYADLIRKGYDADKAELLTMELGKQKFWNMAKEYGAKTEAAKANIAAAAVPEEEAAREASINNTKAEMAGQSAFQLMQPRVVAGGGGGGNSDEMAKRYIPGVGYARSVEQRDKIVKALGNKAAIAANMREIAKYRRTLDAADMIAKGSLTNKTVDKNYRRLKQLVSKSQALITVDAEQGTISGGDAQRSLDGLADVMSVTNGDNAADVLEMGANDYVKDGERLLRAEGVMHGQEGYAYDPKTNGLKPVGSLSGVTEKALKVRPSSVQTQKIGK